MTLCAAWIRQVDNSPELVFATDSTLTGGEKWNHGVKLFELPRPDCLLCFAGETFRAYPLILNLTAAIKHNERLRNPRLDIAEVLYSIAEIFTELVKSIFEKPKGDTTQIGGEAKFLFGGWSWRENRFRVWRLYYSSDIEGFAYAEESSANQSRVCVFLGDPEDDRNNMAQLAEKRHQQQLIDQNKFNSTLDMEPLSILVNISRDSTVRYVDGALQIGKVYRSGSSEFFGVMWPSVEGDHYFLGKRYERHNKPRVRYFDPDTCELIEDQLPLRLPSLIDFADNADYAFLKECYCEEGDYMKSDVSESERDRLIGILREHSYRRFLQMTEDGTDLSKPQITLTDE
jgi:hypothetical protein